MQVNKEYAYALERYTKRHISYIQIRKTKKSFRTIQKWPQPNRCVLVCSVLGRHIHKFYDKITETK